MPEVITFLEGLNGIEILKEVPFGAQKAIRSGIPRRITTEKIREAAQDL